MNLTEISEAELYVYYLVDRDNKRRARRWS